MQRNRALLFDTFCYNGEPIVELRLKYLAPHVDQFVIVEARQTHSGMKKAELYAEKYKDVFEPYKDKIQFIIIEEFPEMPEDWPKKQGDETYMKDISYEAWYRERYQRDIAKEYLLAKFADKEFVVICGDVDEVIKDDIAKDLVKQYFAFGDPVYLEMKFYYYNFGWQKKFPWYMAYVVNDLGLRRNSLSFYRTQHPKTQFIANAGWHASYFLNVPDLQRKLESFAHRECDKHLHKSRDNLRKCLKEGQDISMRGSGEDCAKTSTSTLPKLFQEFNEKLLFLQTYS